MAVIPFVNKEQMSGRKTLEALVAHYRKFMQTPFQNPNDDKDFWVWGAPVWKGVFRFIRRDELHNVKGTRGRIPENCLIDLATMEVMQALAIHFYITQNRKTNWLGQVCTALSILEMVLRKRANGPIVDFASITVMDLNNCVDYAKSVNLPGSLVLLVSTVKLLGLLGVIKSQAVLMWVNPLAHAMAKERYQKSLIANIENSSYKLPNRDAVIALSNYFRNQPWLTKGDDPADLDPNIQTVIVSCAVTIMLIVPSRSQDLFEHLSEYALINRQVQDSTVWGIDWYASKTDMDHIKWVPHTVNGVFENTIKEAFARILHVTEAGRRIYKTWDEQCPEYKPEVYQEALSKGWLPKDFPIYSKENNVRYSNALMVMLKHQQHPRRNTIMDRADYITKDNFRDWLRTSKGKNQHTGKPLIRKGFFDRIGCEGLSLEPDDYNSHSYRHLVNTAARLGGMSEFDVNWWSHRRTMGEVYDHRTPEHQRNLIATGNYEAREFTPEEILNQINDQMPLTRKNLGFRFEIVPNAHGGFTFSNPLGTCTHNYVETPCLRTVNCLECPENAYCKGDKRAFKNLKEEFEEINQKIELAEKEGDAFALRRLNTKNEIASALLKILGDDSPLEDGAIVMLTHEQAPKAGLDQQAKAVAEQIKNGSNLIKIKHEEAIKKLGLSRALPIIDDVEQKKSIIDEISIDGFLLDYQEGDDE